MATRIGVRNRYKWDYACEDEYYEREMTLLEARHLPLPLRPLILSHRLLRGLAVLRHQEKEVKLTAKERRA
jgi:hypothetical protein